MPRPRKPEDELRAELKSARTMLCDLRREVRELRDENEAMGGVLDAVMNVTETEGKIDHAKVCEIIGASPTPKGAAEGEQK